MCLVPCNWMISKLHVGHRVKIMTIVIRTDRLNRSCAQHLRWGAVCVQYVCWVDSEGCKLAIQACDWAALLFWSLSVRGWGERGVLVSRQSRLNTISCWRRALSSSLGRTVSPGGAPRVPAWRRRHVQCLGVRLQKEKNLLFCCKIGSFIFCPSFSHLLLKT